MENVYLIPVGNSGYRAEVAFNMPAYDAILLTKERSYPVTFWARMYNKHIDSRLHFDSANSRDELIRKLNVMGNRGAAVVKIWDYCEHTTPDNELSELFANCLKARVDEYWQETQSI